MFARKAADEERCCFGTIESLLNMLLFSLFALAAVALTVVVPCVVVCSGGPVLVCGPLELLILTENCSLTSCQIRQESWLIYKLCGGAAENVHVTDVSNASRLWQLGNGPDVLVFDHTGIHSEET